MIAGITACDVSEAASGTYYFGYEGDPNDLCTEVTLGSTLGERSLAPQLISNLTTPFFLF